MLRSSRLLLSLGIVSALLASRAAPAAVWSVEADCKRGDWSVVVELTGFGPLDLSCADGGKTRLSVDDAEWVVTGGRVSAISSLGTVCEGPEASDSKFVLKCGSEFEDATGFEVEEELEVEVEREETDEPDEPDEPEGSENEGE